jgi:hypothetical protein
MMAGAGSGKEWEALERAFTYQIKEARRRRVTSSSIPVPRRDVANHT